MNEPVTTLLTWGQEEGSAFGAPEARVAWMVCPASAVPSGPEAEGQAWLSLGERARFQELRFPKRRHDWLLGRWAMKALLRRELAARGFGDVPPEQLQILPEETGAPVATLLASDAGRLPLSISISHSGEWALVACSAELAVGADLEHVEPRPPALLEDFFTQAEREAIGGKAGAERSIAAIWAAKEAALKVVRRGLTVDTRRVECRFRAAPDVAAWSGFDVALAGALGPWAGTIRGRWRAEGQFVWALAAARAPGPA